MPAYVDYKLKLIYFLIGCFTHSITFIGPGIDIWYLSFACTLKYCDK